MSTLTSPTKIRCHFPEDYSVNVYRGENGKSYKIKQCKQTKVSLTVRSFMMLPLLTLSGLQNIPHADFVFFH